MKQAIGLSLLCVMVLPLVAPNPAAAQSTGNTVTYPRDNVRGGALSSRRPGIRQEAAIANHRSRMTVVTSPQNGVTVPEDTGQDRHTLLLTTFLESLFNTLNQLATALAAAAAVSGTATTTGS